MSPKGVEGGAEERLLWLLANEGATSSARALMPMMGEYIDHPSHRDVTDYPALIQVPFGSTHGGCSGFARHSSTLASDSELVLEWKPSRSGARAVQCPEIRSVFRNTRRYTPE